MSYLHNFMLMLIKMQTVFGFDSTHTIYVVFQSRRFYDVPRVLISDARSFQYLVWQAVTAKSPSSFKSWSNRLLTLASCKSSMVRLEKVWANLVKRWLSLVWEASVLASKFSISR